MYLPNDKIYFSPDLSRRERACFETGIKLGALYHILSGIPIRNDETIISAIEKGIESRNNRIYLTASVNELRKRPYLMMRSFLASARTGFPLYHRSKKLVSEHLDLVTDKLRSSSRMSRPFFEISRSTASVISCMFFLPSMNFVA